MRWSEFFLLLSDTRVQILLVIALVAIIIAVVLIVYEFRINRKKVIEAKVAAEETYIEKVRRKVRSSKTPKGKLDRLDLFVKKYLHEHFGVELNKDYSEILKDFEKRKVGGFKELCEVMLSTYYSTKNLEGEKVEALLNSFIDLVKHKEKIDYPNKVVKDIEKKIEKEKIERKISSDVGIAKKSIISSKLLEFKKGREEKEKKRKELEKIKKRMKETEAEYKNRIKAEKRQKKEEVIQAKIKTGNYEVKALKRLEKMLSGEILELKEIISSYERNPPFVCDSCNRKVTPANALESEYNCEKCGGKYKVMDDPNYVNLLKGKLARLENSLKFVRAGIHKTGNMESKKIPLDKDRQKWIKGLEVKRKSLSQA